jgi:hypothetical protein
MIKNTVTELLTGKYVGAGKLTDEKEDSCIEICG